MDKKKLISNLSGLTSNVQTQINGKANTSHTHTKLKLVTSQNLYLQMEVMLIL